MQSVRFLINRKESIMQRAAFFLLVFCSEATAGPYIESGLDYDQTPAFNYRITRTPDGVVISEERKEASHYIGVVSLGWEWENKNLLSDGDALTVRLKLFEHRSDPMNDGIDDVVSKNKIRGLSVKYKFW